MDASRGGEPAISIVAGPFVHGALAAVAALGVAAGLVLAACAQSQSQGSLPLRVTSNDYVVRGEYRFVDGDRIDALTIENGRAVLKGSPADLAVDLPPAADPARPLHHWALVTDAHVDGHRLVIFTHSEAVKDVSVELPDGESPVRFAAFASRTGNDEVLVFASGDRKAGSPSLVGHVAIHPK
jgi:hypothetical protein